MEKLLEYLLNNSVLSYAIILIVILLIGIVITMLVIAFIQGREIKLWPPSIGKRDNQKHIGSNISSALVSVKTYSGYCSDYENAHRADSDAIKETVGKFEFLGISSQFLYTREGFINFFSNRAIEFKFLLLDPESKYTEQLEKQEGIPVRRNIISSIYNLLDLKPKNNSIEIRLYNRPPLFRIIAIDRSKCFVGYYSATHNNPQVSFTRGNQNRSFAVPFLRIFDEIWEEGKPVDYEYLSKFNSPSNSK